MHRESDSTTVSVIVPVYSAERWLHRCLNSILAQSHPSLDVILIDDGSPDSCGEICDAYAAMDDRVTVVHESNQGPSAARNAGIAIATGTYITFVDADDWIHRDFIRKLLDVARKDASTIAMSDFVRTDGATLLPPLSRHHSMQLMDTAEALERLHTDLQESLVVPWGKLIPSEIVGNVRFPQGRHYEDEFTTYRFLANSQNIAWVKEPLYYYFVHPESRLRSSSQHVSASIDSAVAMEERLNFLLTEGYVQAAVLSRRKLAARYIAVARRAMYADDKSGKKWVRQRGLGLVRDLGWSQGDVRARLALIAYLSSPRLAEALRGRISPPRRGGQ